LDWFDGVAVSMRLEFAAQSHEVASGPEVLKSKSAATRSMFGVGS
jgi:hypothetical protein